MKIIKVENYNEMSQYASQKIIKKVNNLQSPVLGLATGSTPEGVYGRLKEAYQKKEVSFRHAFSFNLDEYIGLTDNHPNSYRMYMKQQLFNHIDIPDSHTFIPDGDADNLEEECEKYNQTIKEKNGIDLQLLGLGLNGHIGFNEPGSSFSQQTHVVKLTESTRQANARFFDSQADVPTHAITMGIETIMSSKEILLLVSGAEKAEALQKLIKGEISEQFPASILQKHPNTTVIADKYALPED